MIAYGRSALSSALVAMWLTAVAGCASDPRTGRPQPEAGADGTANAVDAGIEGSVPPETPDVVPPPPSEPEPTGCAGDAGADRVPDVDDDIHGLDGCRPVPSRLVVLGDSIAACWPDRDSPNCAPRHMAEHLRATVSPDLELESHATFGSGVEALPGQASAVESDSGHVLVWIFSIGNDLLGGLLAPSSDLTAVRAALEETLATFDDASRFPGGVTFLLNGQYGPYDQCDVPGSVPGYAPELVDPFHELNQILFFDTADARADTVAIDHYPDWLGHGNNAHVRGCPHCATDNQSWMADRLHPNAAGHRHIAEKWYVAFESMYGPACTADR